MPVVESDTEGLSAEDEAAVNALPRGSALLIVQRGPNAGSRFLLNTDAVSAGRHQDSDIFLDDISVSRRHATFTRTPDGIEDRDLRQPERHLRQPGPGRLRPCCGTATRCRSASSAWSSSPARRASTRRCWWPPTTVPSSIGQVLSRRSVRDFPDISISKIRFLESEGLVTPQRAPSGYRRYVESDIDRLRYVLTVQRDHYLPLKVIREHLA